MGQSFHGTEGQTEAQADTSMHQPGKGLGSHWARTRVTSALPETSPHPPASHPLPWLSSQVEFLPGLRDLPPPLDPFAWNTASLLWAKSRRVTLRVQHRLRFLRRARPPCPRGEERLRRSLRAPPPPPQHRSHWGQCPRRVTGPSAPDMPRVSSTHLSKCTRAAAVKLSEPRTRAPRPPLLLAGGQSLPWLSFLPTARGPSVVGKLGSPARVVLQ